MIVAVLLAKLTAWLLRLFRRGATTLPGRLALKIKPDILRTLADGVHVICITGTNGKTTTCALLSYALKAQGCSFFTNKSGANMLTGVVAAFLENATLRGKCRCEYAVLECDENSLPKITQFLQPEVLAVTNIFRDQLDRYGEVSRTVQSIRQSISQSKGAVLVLSADCPLTYSLRDDTHPLLTFGIDDNLRVSSIASDNRYCPVCSSTLRYHSRVYAQLGDFYCPKCRYCRCEPDIAAADISCSEDGAGFLIKTEAGAEICKTSLPGIYNVYNFLTAAAVLHALGRDDCKALCRFTGAFGRTERFQNGRHTVLLLLVKNPVGLSGCIRYICSVRQMPSLCFSLNDNDADGRDVSWIWDSDFTPIAERRPAVYTCGIRSEDMAVRLKYDGITPAGVLEGEDYVSLLKIMEETDGDFAVFASYTSMMRLRRVLLSRFGGKEFWE